MKKEVIVLLFLLVLLFTPGIQAETVIYDTLTPSNYAILTISDDLNIKYINDYSYDVYLNGSFLGTFLKNEKIQIPDGSNITIYIPEGNINTDASSLWDSGRTQMYIAAMYIGSAFVFIFVLYIVIRKIISKKRY